MADTAPSVEPRPDEPFSDGSSSHVHVHDSFNITPRRARDKTHYVHPAGYEDGANVWRFVIAGEAFTPEEITEDELMNFVDRVFLGETNPLLPTVTYEWVSINDEPIEEDPLDAWEDDGGLIP